jgi:chemotaxis methyl-accepting protein methylase
MTTKRAQSGKRRESPAVGAAKEPAARHETFPIVGIGASAGGLEALEQFLEHTPPESGLAFVIVQHLDPTHKGVMAELLQRATPMDVVQVKDRTVVEANHVYVIPPNKDMSILHGRLLLLDPTAPRGLRLPIDFFFRSLADDRREMAIGVVLSGMGSDGTMGLKAIKEKAGVVFVQDPPSAKFDSMPRSAIDAGVADIVAPVGELPGKIIAYLERAPLVTKAAFFLEGKAQTALEKIVILLRSHTGHDFSLYKKSTVYRRIERRMGIHQIDGIGEYVRFLQENPQELELLFKELLIGVTSFFRDPDVWEQLKGAILAQLANRVPSQPLRAWVPGCSTGEEAYSLAIVFKEAIDQIKPRKDYSLQVFATDLDREAVDRARQGSFPSNISADVSPERLNRFFVKEENGFKISKEIREMVVFATQNIVMDPPFTKLDILSCRNLLIYLSPELQKKLLPLFHYTLNPQGILLLGTSETIGTYTDLFSPLDSKSRLYRRADSPLRAEPINFPTSYTAPRLDASEHTRKLQSIPNLQSLAEQVLLQKYSPAAVLVNDKGDIVYISGRTGKYLEPAAGKANWNIFVMAREGLRYELADTFQKALRQKGMVTLKDLKVGTNGGVQVLDLTVQALTEPEGLSGMVMIVFSDVVTPIETKAAHRTRRGSFDSSRIFQMEEEVRLAREELHTTREEMQTSQEELKSANEELQSTNEELQSTNEELTTSKEEMQSMNEEMQTVNHELRAKVDELSQANTDMKNLLDSTDIATLFLDSDLRVRRFTSQATKVIKLIPGDVGRPITDLSSSLVYPELAEDVREVLRTLVFFEKKVATRDGRWFMVRTMPYRTLENMIDGVVMTFTDITTSTMLEAKLKENMALYAAPFEKIVEGVILQTTENGITFVNAAAERILGLPRALMEGRSIATLFLQAVGEDGSPFSEEDHPATYALNTGKPSGDVVMSVFNPSSQRRVRLSMSATPVVLPGEEKSSHVYMVFHEIPENRTR